jgi:hypothetical protein
MGFSAQRFSAPHPGHPPVAIKRNYPLYITTASLPDATVGSAYSATLAAGGGVPPYRWSIISGALPDGLSMDSSGNITGTPGTVGLFNFTVQVLDPLGNVGTANIGVSL